MPTFAEIVETLPQGTKALLHTEINKFTRFLGMDVKTLNAEQLSALLSLLATEKNGLSVKVIQLETQLQEKKKELEKVEKEILEKYNISDISGLELKKEEASLALQAKLQELKDILDKTKA